MTGAAAGTPAKLWRLLPPASADALTTLAEFGPLGAQLLYNRGLTEGRAARSYLEPSAEGWPDPFLLPDMGRAVDRVLQARESGAEVTVYGDYDADGISGSALLVLGLSLAGIAAGVYIPHREREGYGLNQTALDTLRRQGTGLVITVDNGTSAWQEIEHAASSGLDVVVLDHHAIPPRLPSVPVVNPHRDDSGYPFRDFCGAGVAFKFLQALFLALGRSQEDLEPFVGLPAIGTVADVTPLQGENRRLVRQGLSAINSRPSPGLAGLMRRAGLTPGQVNAQDLAFMVAPRLNAMGRLEHALASYHLLVTQDEDEATTLAEQLEMTNRARQLLTLELVERAHMSGERDAPLTFVSGPDYPVGMVGLVAGRLAEEWFRPAVVVEEGPVQSRGSARSIPGVSIVDLLHQCQDLLQRYGGHPQAAGFTIETVKLPALRERLMDAAERALEGVERQPVLTIEATTRMRALPGPTMALLGKLAPFGAGNPEPLFLTKSVPVHRARSLGAQDNHLELTVKEDGAVWRGIGFGMGQRLPEAAGRLDLVYSLGLDRLDGNGLLQLRLRDFRPALPE